MSGLFGKSKHTSTAAEQLSNMSIQTSGYGRCIPVVYGKNRVAANLVYYDDFRAIARTEKQKTGKGGGGSTQTNTTYTYTASVILGLCEGPVSVGRVWIDKEEYANPGKMGFTVMTGAAAQSPWTFLTSKHPDKAVGYGSTAYAARAAMDLGDNAAIKNHSFEITGFCQIANQNGDVNPADVIFDMLTHSIHGMNFPIASIDAAALNNYKAYANAAGLHVSAAIEDQKQGIEVLKNLLECTNSMALWSDGKLRILPFGDVDIGNWQASSTPQYALTVDDFLGRDDPILARRKTSADAYNSVKVKFKDRAEPLNYSENVAEASDLAMQDLYGIREASEFNADFISEKDAAQLLAQILLQKYVAIRNEYEFKLGWRYTRLEPGDLVTLTEPGLGLNNTPVRITSIEEDSEGELTVIAVDWPNGIATAVAYPAPPRDGAGGGFNMAADPGNCNTPVIFEPPGDLTGGRLQVWIGASGGDNWGGCEIHASRDNISYSLTGKITAPARHGTITTAITSLSNTIAVDLTASQGALISVLTADANNWQTLSYLDGELISYQTATLTSANRYSLSTVKRGLYSTQAKNHAANSKFMRLDDAVAVIDLERWNKGETIYLKFLSFNAFGQSLQDPALVNPITYKILGTGLTTWKAPASCAIAITDTMPITE